eukprot:scaffold282276_cov27-Tisochrysis_lutea.AAC.5
MTLNELSSPPTACRSRAISAGTSPEPAAMGSSSAARTRFEARRSIVIRSVTLTPSMTAPSTKSRSNSQPSAGGLRQPTPQPPSGKRESGGKRTTCKKADAMPGEALHSWQQPPKSERGGVSSSPTLRSLRLIISTGFLPCCSRTRRHRTSPSSGCARMMAPFGYAAPSSVLPPGSARRESSYRSPLATSARKGFGASSHHASFRPRSPAREERRSALKASTHQEPSRSLPCEFVTFRAASAAAETSRSRMSVVLKQRAGAQRRNDAEHARSAAVAARRPPDSATTIAGTQEGAGGHHFFT